MVMGMKISPKRIPTKILNALKTRLPNNEWHKILKKSYILYKTGGLPFYKRQLHQNIRAYFHIKPYYPRMLYKKADTDIPDTMYHMCDKTNLESILKDGICNHKTSMVFLSSSQKYISGIVKIKPYKEPFLLEINTRKMHEDGHLFFNTTIYPCVWITEFVPPAYLVNIP